jgi:hypothetical protein
VLEIKTGYLCAMFKEAFGTLSPKSNQRAFRKVSNARAEEK